MLPLLFGSLSNWLTRKHQAPRAERRERILKARKQVKNLVLETLEDRVTPANTAYLYNNLNVLQGTFTSVSAIQNAVNAVTASNWRIDVETGNYENVSITGATRSGLTIQAISGQTPVIDAAFGPTIVVQIDTSGVTLRGMTIQDSGTPDAVVGVNFTSNSGNSILENNIIQHFTRGAATFDRAINVNAGADGLEIRNNTITGNYWGIRFNSFATINNLQIHNNFITNNTDSGIYVEPGFNGSNNRIFDNSITGNGASVHNGSATTVDVSRNWWGSNVESTIQGSFSGSGTFDFTPFINYSTDTSASVGFQPDLSYLNVTVLGSQVGATGRIQEGIDGVQDGSLTSGNRIVNVLAGTFAENDNVNKAVSLRGANFGTSGSGSRVTETIVVPGANDVASGSIFSVTSNNVTIDGFTIDGDNGSISGGQLLNGVDSNAANGVEGTQVSNLTVANNRILNFVQNGIHGIASATATGNNSFTNNLIDNMPLNGPTYYGRGILVEDNFYVSASGNVITRARTGIQTNNYNVANPGAAASIANNTITFYVRGIFHNLHYQNASTWSISSNTITADGAAVAGNGGLQIYSIQDAVSVTVSGNSISNAASGIEVWNVPTSAGITISGGSVSNSTSYGLNLNNLNGYGDASGTANVTLNGVAFSNNATGLRVFDDPANSNGSVVRLILTGGVTVNGGTTGLTSSGSDAHLDALNNTFFANVSPISGQYIALSNGSMNGVEVDGTNVTYGSVIGNSANLAQGFAIEDKITHGTDAAGLGYVRITPNLVYVTQNSGSIQRGINVAAGADSIYVEAGTYAENLTINKSVSVLGPNEAISASTLVTRNPEAVIQAVGVSPGRVVNLTASNVTVRGFTITGYDPLAGSWGTTSSNAQANAAEAFRNTGTINNLSIQNNIIQNAGIGVRLDGLSTSNVIDNNWFKDIGAYDYGYAVSLRTNFYADVTNNRMTQVHSGLHTNNFSVAGPATWLFQNNIVQAYAAGVWDNLQYASATSLTINNNNISMLTAVPTVPNYADFNGKSIGLLFVTLQNNVTATVTNNTINGMAYGAVFYNTESSNPIVLNSTNTISNSTTAGILLTNIVGFNPVGSTVLGGGANNPTGVGKVVLDNINLTNNATGIINQGNSAFTSFGTLLTLQNGTGVTGGSVGLSVIGDKAGFAGNTLANTTFTGQSGNYITLSSGALGSPFTYLDGTGVTYDGVVGSAATVAQGFAIEDKITHGTDTAGLGYVRITPNIVYVTASSGSIQRGINVATPGDTIDVQAGTYKENLTVNKAVSLVGPNSALAGNAVRGAEAIIMTNGPASAVITVTASNASIKGFLITGDDNTYIAGTPVYSGADANALYAITNGNTSAGTPINNLAVQNNIVQRVAIGYFGNSFDGTSQVLSTSNTIDNNLFQDIGVYDFGYAVSLRNDFNANVTNNVMKRVWTGVIVNNNSLTASGFRNITGNIVQSYAAGLWDNQAYSSATPLNVANNSFTKETQDYQLNPLAAPVNNIGILVTGGPGFVGSTFTNNSISNHDYGFIVWGTDPGITFGSGNSINNAQVGVYVTNNVGFNPIGTTALNLVGTNASVNLTGLAINNVTSKGIWVRGDTGGGTATVTLSSTTISSASTTATGISIDGPNAVVAGATLADTQFTGFTNANNRFVNFTNGAYNGPVEIDGTSAMYNGVAGGNTLSLPNAFSIEDKINDYLDINNAGSANVGLVRLRAGHVYVTQNSESIQRGVNAASSGDFLYVSAGTFAEAVTVNKPLTIRGAQYGVNANTRFAAFVTGVDGPKANPAVETVLTAAATDPSNPANDTLHIMADNITVDGLVVDGNNPALAQGGATVIGGINTDSRRGIQTEDAAGNFFAVNNLTLQNNIVQNFSQRGIQLINPTGTSPATSGNLITGNVVRNIGQDAIRLQWNAYSDVTNNTIVMPVNGEAGIWMQDFSNNGASPKTVDISNNNVTVSQDAFGGIWANLIYAPNATINIHDNTVNAAPGVTGTSDYTFGIYLSSLQGGTTATLTNNTVGSAGGEFARGISLWNLPTTVTTTVTGGSVGNSLIGVSVHYNDPNFGGAGASTVVNLSNIAISAVNQGVLVESVGTAFTTQAQLSGLTISGSVTGIHLDGATASLVGNTLSNTIFTGITGNYVSLTNSAGNGPVEIDGTGASYNGVAGGNTLSLSNGFAIDDKINDYLDKDVAGSATVGFVRLRSGHVYVTQLSDSVQRGVDVALANETVHVNNSTIIEDVTIGTAGVKLVGAGPGNSTISGAIGGSGSTIAIAASNVLVDGFTITREGNAVATWNDPLNTAGISIQGLGITNAEIRNNNFFGNRTGIDINNSGGHSIHNNVINDNRTGMIFRNQTDNISVFQNSIANNWTVGVVFLDGSGGTNTPPQQAVGTSFFNNNISGNWYGQVVDRQTGGSLPAPGTNVKNFSGNWFGSITPVITNANSAEPGYATLIPVAFGGTSTPPGGQPDIAGPGSANIDISPYLNSGIDTDPGTYGFQGDFSNLWVTDQLAQTGSASRIQEGYDLVVDPAGPAHGLVHILGGSYAGDFLAAAAKDVDLSPGTSPAQVTVNGNFTLNSGITLVMEINGTTPGTGYDQFVVTGNVTLGNATLNVTRDPNVFIPTNTPIRLIDKTSGGAISGLFNGISEGSVLTLLNIPFTASYVGGTGNDFTLTVAPPTDVWVNGSWSITSNTGGPGLTPGDIVATTGGQQLPVAGLIFGYNAYATIQTGVDNVVTSGTVHVVSGTYNEDININKALSLVGPNAGINPNTNIRIAEAVIHPGTQNADINLPNVPNIYVAASGVTIDGFLIDGNNPGLTSGFLVNGIDVDSNEAIGGYDGVGNINVQNNRIINQTYAGIDFYNYYNGGAATGDNYLRYNQIDNIGYIPFGYGIGVLVYNNFYAAVDSNVMTNVRLGVQTGNFSNANPGSVAPSISNNEITATRRGIFHNLQYSNAAPFTISGNTITAATEAGGTTWSGIAITSIQSAVGATISNNIINATAATVQIKSGYFAWNNPTSNTISISGGSVTGADYGIQASNYHPTYFDAASSSLIVNGVSILNSAIAGIWSNDSPSNSNNATVAVTVTGNTTITGSPTGILVSGSDASANINNNLSSIHGNVIGIDVNAGSATITSNSIYDNGTGIRFTNSGSGSVTSNNFLGPITNFLANNTDLRIDATAGAVTIGSSNLFGGGSSNVGQFANPIGYYIDNRSSQNFNLVGSSSTFNRSNGTAWTALSTGVLADNFRIEDRLYHALDYAASGLIRVVANTLYVTTPGTGFSDETIQRGVDAASTGDTIRVEAGTYAENVIVDEEVTIWGAGQGSTIVVPSFVGANTGGGSLAPGASSIFLVRSNNVTIRNLTADGDNTLLTGGESVNGANVDARNGIITDHNNVATVLNLNVHDVTVKNVYLRGIYASTSFGTFTINNNIVQNVAGDPNGSIGIFNFGGGGTISGNQVSQTIDGISANWSTGTTFSGNTVSNSGSGIHTDNAGGYGGPSVPDLIQGNTILNGTPTNSYGIFVFVPYNNVQISNNIITNVDVGLAAFAGAGGSSTFTSNQVDTASRAGSFGAYVSTTALGYGSGSVYATFTGNTIKNGATLLYVEQENANDDFAMIMMTGLSVNVSEPTTDIKNGSSSDTSLVSYGDSANDSATLSDVTSEGVAGKDTLTDSDSLPVYTNNRPYIMAPVTATVVLNGNSFDNSATSLLNTIGIDVNGGTVTMNAGNQIIDVETGLRMDAGTTTVALTGNTLSNLSYSGVTGNYITLKNGALDNQEINGTGVTYNGVVGSSALTPQGFAIEDKIQHAVDAATLGFIRVRSGQVYVTTNSFAPSEGTSFADIQRGIDASNSGETVWVAAGTFNNDLLINKSINLFGAGIDTTYVYGVGPIGSPYTAAERGSATMQVLASGVVVDGFTITRDGNNTTNWNDATLNLAGLAVQGQTNSVEVRYSKFIGNRTGIDVNNSNGNNIHNNIIDNNRTGLIFRNQTDNTNVSENFITNNWTVGVLFLDGSGGSNSPVQSAANSTFFNNNISGNWYGQIVDRQFGGALPAPGTNIKNFSGNWLGTTSPVVTTANSTEPGYAVQIPVMFGGSAVPPGGQPDIAGGASANIDYTPYLGTGVDLDSNPNNGFQGDFSNLWVTSDGAQSGALGRITEALGLATSGGTITILGGSYVDNVNTTAQSITLNLGAGSTSAQVTINGSLTMGSTTTVNFNMNGPNTTTPVGGTDYDQIVTTGATSLGGATFNITKAPAYFPVIGANFALIRSTLSKTGSFNYGGLVAENAIIAVSGINFKVNYNLGSGPFDLNLGVVIPNNIVYVWNGWSGQSLGDFYQVAPPTSTLAAPPGGYVTFSGDPVTYGYNAYSSIQAAINAVSSGATIRIYSGTYSEDITVSTGKNNLQLVAFGASGTRTINGVVGGPSATITLQGTGTLFSGNSALDNFVVNQTAADNLAGIRTAAGSLGTTVSYVNVSGSNNATNFTGVDVGAGTWVNYSNGAISNYRTGIKVNSNAGTVANPVNIQTSNINGAGWASLTIAPVGVDVGLNGYAKLTNNNIISGNRWGVRVLGGTAMLQGNNLSGNNHMGASAAGLFVANGGVVDAGQVIDGSELNYTGLGISTGSNNFATGYSMNGAQAIVNLNANFDGSPSGTGNLTDGTNVSARNNNFGTTVYGNIEQIVNHAIDNNFQGYVDYRNATGAVAPQQEGTTDYYAVAPGEDLPNQRSMIRGMQFVIDSPVVIQSGAFTLTRRADQNPSDYLYFYTSTLPQNASVPVVVTSSINGATGRTTVNITFSSPNNSAWTAGQLTEYGSLVDGNYRKSLNGSLVNLLFSGSGVNLANGAVVNEDFHRFYGDLNGDTLTDAQEFGASFDAVNYNNSPYNKYFALTGGTAFNDLTVIDDVFARYLQGQLPSPL